MAGARAVAQVLASCVLAVVVVLALVASGLQSGSHLELLAKTVGAGAAAPARGDGVSAQTIQRIMVKMEKKDHKPMSKAVKLKNAMAAEQIKLANLKIRKSNAFAIYEKEQTAATSASTKAATAHDEFKQDAARERMAKRKLQRLTDRCAPSHYPPPETRNPKYL
ncbi:hypothetical protein T484DRAFT_2191982 [Baffinella frigidus]|nr:hypothetical protein T484DRAFT_2191982 [Cryptophyta sp. CCMP2293]